MIYRKRVTIEHLISSMKCTAGIKPLRVWKDSSIRGALVLGMLSEAVIGMARYEMKERKERKRVKGKTVMVRSKPSAETIVRSLSHLTVTKVIEGTRRKTAIYSNWEPISTEIMDNIRNPSAVRRCAGTVPG